MNFWDRLKLIFRADLSEYTERFIRGEETMDGAAMVTTDIAMKYSAVFACNKVLAETFASLPAVLYKKDMATGGREAVNDLILFDILHNKPNDEMAPFNFKEAAMTSLNLGGNFVAERLFNAQGKLIGLYPYAHDLVTITRNKETKKLVYTIKDGTESKILLRDQVLHVPNLGFDGITGLSPISYAAKSILLGLSYEQFGMGFYGNGANAGGAFKIPGELTEPAFNRLKKEIKNNYQGLKNVGTPMLLEGGLEFMPFQIDPVDAQLLESKSFQIEDVCRIFRVPLHLVQNLNHATFSNIEHQSLEFVMYTMLPICKRFEENINAQLLSPAERKNGYFIEFNVAGLLRGDLKSRYEAYAMGRQNSFLSVNDIRRLENMSPIANGDSYMQPLNFINIDKADEYYSKQQTQTQKAQLIDEIKNLLERG